MWLHPFMIRESDGESKNILTNINIIVYTKYTPVGDYKHVYICLNTDRSLFISDSQVHFMKGGMVLASIHYETAKVFKAFCDENRLQILELLRSGEKCACKLLDDLQISQSTLSHHMKILCDADIVQGRKEGKWVHYSIHPAGAKRAQELLARQVTLETNCKQEMQKECCEK